MIATRRFLLRDLAEGDRAAFVAYHLDPRTRSRDASGTIDAAWAHALFDRIVAWQHEVPRLNLQLGIIERASGRLCGCAGLRRAGAPEGQAVLGIELAPDDWSRYRAAIEIADALIVHGFDRLGLETITGATTRDNVRVDRLARWFGATIAARDAVDVDVVLTRAAWERRQGDRVSSVVRTRTT